MKNIWLITKREYLTQVRKKSFVIMTLLAPLMVVAFGAFISYLVTQNAEHSQIRVVDHSGFVMRNLVSDDEVAFVNAKTDDIAALKKNPDDGYDGLLVIPALHDQDFERLQKETKLYVNGKINYASQEAIEDRLTKVVRSEKIKSSGLTEAQLAAIDQKFDLNTENLDKSVSENGNYNFEIKSVLSMLLLYVTFMFIVIYGVRIMRGVLEEKNNRVVEIIISSVKPFELMMGKILGVTLVAVTQFAVWIAITVVAAKFLGGASAMGGGLASVTQSVSLISKQLLQLNYLLIIGVFLVFFLLGYIFYSSIYAAIGSAVDNDTETQQFTIIAVLPLMIGLYGSFTILKNPDGPMAMWLSMVPFTSPIAMVARIPFGVPVWQILVSGILLLLSCLGMVFIAGKIYRIGILMYGNKASFKELWKWIRS